MRHRRLGRTGLYVSEICLGTMTFGGQGAWWKNVGQVDQSSANALVERALAAGVNFIDTADVYSEGLSEKILRSGTARSQGAARKRNHRDQGARTNRSRPQHGWPVAQSHHECRGSQPKAPQPRLYRPISGSRCRPGYADRGNHARARQSGVARPGSLHRRLQHGRVADHEGDSGFRANTITRGSKRCSRYYTIAGRDLEREIIPDGDRSGARPDGLASARGRLCCPENSRARPRIERRETPGARFSASRQGARTRRR